MTPEEKKRVDAVLRHFPKGTLWVFRGHIESVWPDLLVDEHICDAAKREATYQGIVIARIGGIRVAHGTWEGDPLDDILPLGKWVDNSYEVRQARDVARERGETLCMLYEYTADTTRVFHRRGPWPESAPPEPPPQTLAETNGAVVAAIKAMLDWSREQGTSPSVIEAMCRQAFKPKS